MVNLKIKLRTLVRGAPVCFLHIGKNGGTTLLNMIDNHVQDRTLCKLRHMEEIAELSVSELNKYDVFRGHFWYDVWKLIGRKPKYFTMLRDPLDRARSVYEHLHRYEHGRHHIVKDMSFEEYVQSAPSVSLDIRNWQTRVITNCIDPDEEPDLELAKRRIEKDFPFVGFLERYSDSVELLGKTFSWDFEGEMKVLNVTENSIKKQKLSGGMKLALSEMNSKDLDLYRFCFNRFEKALNDFRF